MSDSTGGLPIPFPEATIVSLSESLQLGQPISIQPLKVTAAFHIIYVLIYEQRALQAHLSAENLPLNAASHVQLILRIAGDHVPSIKTGNEVATLKWLRANTSIPVPEVVAYDMTTSNVLGCEYLLTNRCPGVAICDIYETLTAAQLDNILLQLMDMLVELHQHPFSHIGGLTLSSDQEIIPGPMLTEHFWFTYEIPKYFPSSQETYTSLNYSGPFNTYTDYVSAAVTSYLHVARIHPSLEEPLRPFLPRVASFLDLLPEHASTLNQTPIRLAHKDLHFANILYDPKTDRVTAILDWEFAGTIPFPQWDPVRAFLWNARSDSDSLPEKYRLRDRFAQLCKEKGVNFMDDANFTSQLQENMHMVRNSMRGITTNIPRGTNPEAVKIWFTHLEKGLTAFGV